MKYIIFPLVFLIAFACLSMMGMGTIYAEGKYSLRAMQNDNILYDDTGHAVCYGNLTAIGEPGEVIYRTITFPVVMSGLLWNNGTLLTDHQLYWDTAGESPVTTDLTQDDVAIGGIGFQLSQANGILVIIGALMLFIGIISLRIFGFGMSEMGVGVIFKGTAFMAIWGIFTFLGSPLMLIIPWVGGLFYFFLTVIYGLGIMESLSASSG